MDQELYRFRAIIGHQGPLLASDPDWKGSKYNVQVEWETGEITFEPLSIIAADDPVTCAAYARENDLDEKENLEILDKDDAEVKKAKKPKQAMRVANKKGYRDLVMYTEGISQYFVENSTSDKFTKGDLRKAWGRLERCWNPKTREDKVEFYTKFLSYKLENVRQRPMDWLAFLERKRTELANTRHIMDDETFITHLLNSLPQVEYEAATLVIKEKLRRGTKDLPEIEQILEGKYQSMKHVKGWDEEEHDYALFASLNNKKGHKKQFKGRCGYCGEVEHKAAN